MECLLLYLDNLDDLYGAVGLVWEDVRNAIALVASALLVLLTATSAFLLAWSYPPLALGVAALLLVVFLLRSVNTPALKSWA
ncbi:MAG: hypothetical protein KJP08_01850 [Gammaproteobacteria bacterium]|nr:hypothetical protein [Gammaproteobacteria bacterium]NNF49400.1 hypothetical protein [Woeseiaceae bacterium]MBT8093527.1 hypothetical protein [Gammaproteobacteria bacterium]MBT8106509.1 hypothetical protein [Gammaproteobacteria bacterium]NNK26524.1 hypothetical protein [Woeseiaceae bacterium]